MEPDTIPRRQAPREPSYAEMGRCELVWRLAKHNSDRSKVRTYLAELAEAYQGTLGLSENLLKAKAKRANLAQVVKTIRRKTKHLR